MEIPADAIKFEKVKGKMHSAVNVLGIAYNRDGTVAARFSDVVKLDFENQKEVKAWQAKPLHYENQFDVAVGTYNLKVVFDSGGASFGKLESPLVINAYDGKDLALSGIAFSTVFVKVSEAEANLDTQLLEGRSPLVAANLQFTPTGAARPTDAAWLEASPNMSSTASATAAVAVQARARGRRAIRADQRAASRGTSWAISPGWKLAA